MQTYIVKISKVNGVHSGTQTYTLKGSFGVKHMVMRLSRMKL